MHSLIHQLLALTWSSNFENKMTHCKKIAPGNPNWEEFWTIQGIWSHKTRKGFRIVKSDMASEKNMRMEESGNGQQEMQEEISQAAKMVINLAKGGGDYWWSQRNCILERQRRPIHCAKSEWLSWAKRIKEKSVWTVEPRRLAAKVQSPRQEAKRD